MTKIFISHSDIDTEFSMKLAQALRDRGIDIWIDKADIRLGKNWSDEVAEGLDTCEAMIVVVSPESMASKNVKDEWQYYLDENKAIFPVIWRPVKLHFQLRRKQHIDFHEQEFSTKIDHLCAELQKQGFVSGRSQGQMHVIKIKNFVLEIGENLPNVDSNSDALTTRSLSVQGREKILLHVENILPYPFTWVEIPGGKVELEDASDRDGGTKGGIFEVSPFKIAKYPITLKQYFEFANKSDGDANPIWWNFSKDAEYAGRFRSRPNYVDSFDDPVTNVTWYDAIAFCRWLSWRTGLQITLPTEQQWQRAAIGDSGWEYTWGNVFDTDKANTRQSGIKRTTPVTQYPQGASPYSVMDMCGNAWEWCLTVWGINSNELDRKGKRCSRGGSYFDDAGYARATYRRATDATDHVDGMGFRICMNS